jgi:hypothetical protein
MKTVIAAMVAVAGVALTPKPSIADEGGVSFWLPGLYGSLAAAPVKPGWSLGTIYYHTSVDAGGDVAAARQATIGRFSRTVNVDLNAALAARPDLVFVVPSYTFATPVLGGQFTLGMATAFGRNSANIDGTLTASVGNLVITRSGSISDERWGFADLYPQATLRWNAGVNNFMTYLMGDIPVGTYDPSNLANFGIGHGAIDGGVGYTYFNPQTGHEFSAVTGLTYNLKNTNTDYQNGVDWHLDWGASQFLSKQLLVGAVGYFYNQLTADSGQLAILGDNKSRVIGVGPQIGYLFPVGDMQGYVNLKSYFEFDASRRPEGWNLWLTFALSPGEQPPPTAPRRPLVTK